MTGEHRCFDVASYMKVKPLGVTYTGCLIQLETKTSHSQLLENHNFPFLLQRSLLSCKT